MSQDTSDGVYSYMGFSLVNQPFNQSHLVQSQVVLVLQNAPKKLKHRRLEKKVQACYRKTTWRSMCVSAGPISLMSVWHVADDSLTFEPSIMPFGVDGPTYPSYLAFLCWTPYNWCLYHYWGSWFHVFLVDSFVGTVKTQKQSNAHHCRISWH